MTTVGTPFPDVPAILDGSDAARGGLVVLSAAPDVEVAGCGPDPAEVRS